MKVGCLFGSFDPPHNGHIAVAQHMLAHADLDAVWLVVTPENPFKRDRNLSPEQHRLAMTRLAVQDRPGLSASGVELDLPRPNYTVDTLAFMRERWPQHSFSLIIGGDNLLGFHQWKEHERILQHHPILVYPRPGADLSNTPLAFHPNITVVHDAPESELSSTGVRVRLRNWKPVEDRVAPAVLAYIRNNGLYTA